MSKEQEIINLMNKLNLSRQEAEALYEDDLSDDDLPEVKELTAKAKKNIKRHYERSDKPRAKPKEKPPDEVKLNFITKIAELLQAYEGVSEVEIFNPTQEVTFFIDNELFSLKLIRHTPKTYDHYGRGHKK